MTPHRSLSRIVFAALVFAVTVPAAAPPARAAGFFDDLANALFGRGPARPPAGIVPENPLGVTVRPQRPRYPEVSSKPSPPVVKLDPATDPSWYLRDPTLRRGDIVVTDRGVLVYQGRDSDAIQHSDFTALGGKDAEKGWKQQLQTAAAGGRSFFRQDDAGPVAAQAATADPATGR